MFRESKYDHAIAKYTRYALNGFFLLSFKHALRIQFSAVYGLIFLSPFRAIELAVTEDEKAVYYSNRATCHAQLQNHEAVVADCSASIAIKPSVKALIRRGLAYESLEKYKLGLEDMRKVLELDPSARVASETIARLTRAINSF